MKTSVNCSKCQTSSVIEGCVQEMLDPSLSTSCCTQTSTETHRRVLGPPALMLLPASLLMTSALSAVAPSSTWAPTSGLVCLVLLTMVGLVLAAESCCERRASRACFVKSNWQFAITPIPAPHPSTPLWSCCLRLGRYLKSIFLANQLFLPPLRFFWLFFPLSLRQLQVLQRRRLKLASPVAFNWTGDQEDIWDMIAVAWPRCPWELMTRLVTGSMRVWLFLSKHQDLQFSRINYCSAQKLNCCWFSPTPLRFSLPSAWSLFPHCLLRKTPLFSKCLVKWQSGRRRQLKSLSRCDSERWITEHLVTIDGGETAKKEKNLRESWNWFGEHRNWIGRITTWKRSMHFSGCGEFDKTTATTTTPLSHTLTHPLQSSPPRPQFFSRPLGSSVHQPDWEVRGEALKLGCTALIWREKTASHR